MHKDISGKTTDLSPEIYEIVKTLVNGDNIVLIGPNKTKKNIMLELLALELRKQANIYLIAPEGQISENTEWLCNEIKSAQSAHASFLVGELSLRNAIFVLTKYPQFTLLASVNVAHIFGVCFEWGKFFGEELGVRSPLIEVMLNKSLEAVRIVGVANPTVSNNTASGFREKLLVDRYNRMKRIVPDHQSLDKNYEKESDFCDPGWELDK